MKIRSVSIVLFSLLFFTSIFPQTIPQRIKGRFVDDFAGIIPAAVEDQIEANLLAYEKATSIEIAVVTVPSLQGDDVDDFTNRLANAWGVGKKGTNNGLVILIAPAERKWRIEVADGLQGDITDATASDIGRQNLPVYFRQGKIGEGILKSVLMIEQKIGNDAQNVREENRRIQAARDERAMEDALNTFLEVILVLAVLGFIVFLVVLVVRRSQKKAKLQKDASDVLSNLPAEVRQRTQYAEGLKKEGFFKADEALKKLASSNGDVDALLADAKGKKVSVQEIVSRGEAIMDELREDIHDLNQDQLARDSVLGSVDAISAKAAALIGFTAPAVAALGALRQEAPRSVWEPFTEVGNIAQRTIDEVNGLIKDAKHLASMQLQDFLEAKGKTDRASGIVGDARDALTGVVAKKEEWDDAKRSVKESGRSEKDGLVQDNSSDGMVNYIAVAAAISAIEDEESRRSSYDNFSSYDSDSSSSDSPFSDFGGGGFDGGGASGDL